ncbi:undecaprenyldiphospho-muramoylpentapeptide beta-N-acetylglucosaminyltransferase [Listeria booriae]|uniref:UDP-N-acetylglucosamine--N-acetylmuramyl-(pentapeptide) pyrophosphoryl-undecaprenol N-acetylglucosamine transferase n=1 Tax=Listeria booriae TaxID=1552123 RepID=A0A841YJT0_9LIST|nr:undecaprenyldiphospho-muramoylpentapeptide beta-N-acetylglucosaminyltransferase [Listeria booriae]MBC1400556.1 undecaprenyldiphospho-muramoylpentapeptide beta-N-acetylglucosaminyltransferase [Listeria booriae]MBC1615718.1 undecaprenyldiphospho-muramoylpentapeptide beta-N-acetylglucosaminyltransferase [Listeria booriae]
MKFIISGGGTGGHIYPALALIRAIKKRDPEAEFLYIGTEKGLESDLVRRENIPFEAIEITGFKRSLSMENIKTITRFFKGVTRSKELIRKFQPDAVIGTGGYVCGPVVYAAAKLNIPTVIHEQNSVAGLTNKFLSRYADRVAICFEEVSDSFAAEKIVFTGNPRASEVIGIESGDVLAEFGLEPGKPTVLVFGGSRGARGINEAVEANLTKFSKRPYQLLYVTGEVHYNKIKDKLADMNLHDNISVQPFIYDMPKVLNVSTLVVSRAGATSLAEFTALGVPSILIPSPYVTANHQEKNAESLAKKEAAVIISEATLAPHLLLDVIDSIMDNPEKLAKMQYEAKQLGVPDAADKLVDAILDIIPK